MRALLDTNIVIHRENVKPTNISIGQLFYWLDLLHYDKVIHQYTIDEIRKYKELNMQKLYNIKLESYNIMKSIGNQTKDFLDVISNFKTSENDKIDNQLLYELYCEKVDILITEDKNMILKADKLGISNRIFTINSFITKCANENPLLIEYKHLSVKKDFFGNIDVNDHFFDTFRESYPNFNKWFYKKCDEEAYICRNDKSEILGFLYLKTEEKNENYNDIKPIFSPKRRLKIGTFKVEASGFRLGERFIKIIFDNAIQRNVDEIYITLFTNRSELKALYDLLKRWGFIDYGTKLTNGINEAVLIKKLTIYDNKLSPKENFPNIKLDGKKFFLPILADYHTNLLPDSQLKNENEVDFLGNKPQRYALQKVYISFSFKRDMNPGDLLIIYRNGRTPGRKKFESVITTIGIIDEYKFDFKNKDEFIRYCENRTVFSQSDLNKFWDENKNNLLVIKFIYFKSLNKRLNLEYLWKKNIVKYPNGPRSFEMISDNHFNTILIDTCTNIEKGIK